MFEEYLQSIDQSKVYDVAVETPLEQAHGLSARLNNRVWLKREDLQPIFAFKIRGAYHKISQLSAEQRQSGVIAASAGNHAQGVALAAKHCGISACIVMPVTTPKIKVDAVRSYGAEIVLQGDTYDQAYQHALKLQEDSRRVFIHPYDDPDIIAGQGTIGKEILAQSASPPDAVFVPVGGGGLIAGLAVWIKQHSPQTRIVAVEPVDAPSLHDALKAGQPVDLGNVGLFADGAAVRKIGEETFRVAQQTVDEAILVSTDEICAAIKDNFDDTRTLLEPAGALALAGLKQHVKENAYTNRNLVAINSGANINFDRMKHIVERYEIGEGTEAILAITIPERPGSFLEFCRTIGKCTVTEFNYRYSGETDAHVFVGLQVDGNMKKNVLANLKGKGYPAIDLSDNEMAKLHLRHMIGGRSPTIQDERLCRFQFPERPGALLEFLECLGNSSWNISLFHYRNHGSAYGRVLAGIQVPDGELKDFVALMESTDYSYQDESDNPSYTLFLS